jgi:hypothetical protein
MSQKAQTQTEFKPTEEQQNFLISFEMLSYHQKQIWQLLCWFNKHCYVTRPSQSTIARMVGCCRDTVIEAVKKFLSYGWMSTIKKAYQSLLYFISDNLLKLDTKDRNIFRKVDISRDSPTQFPTLSRISRTSKGTLLTMDDSNFKVFENRQRSWTYVNKSIPHCLQIPILSDKDKQIIANQFSEAELQSAIKDTKDYWRKYGKPENVAAFLTKIAKEYKAKYRYS